MASGAGGPAPWACVAPIVCWMPGRPHARASGFCNSTPSAVLAWVGRLCGRLPERALIRAGLSFRPRHAVTRGRHPERISLQPERAPAYLRGRRLPARVLSGPVLSYRCAPRLLCDYRAALAIAGSAGRGLFQPSPPRTLLRAGASSQALRARLAALKTRAARQPRRGGCERDPPLPLLPAWASHLSRAAEPRLPLACMCPTPGRFALGWRACWLQPYPPSPAAAAPPRPPVRARRRTPRRGSPANPLLGRVNAAS